MKKYFFLFGLIMFVLFFIPKTLFAQPQNEDKVIILEKNKTVNKDYFAAGSTVIISGTVNGDAYLAGGNVIVDGNIYGDLLVAGGNVNIVGNIANNVRVVAGQLTVSGNIGKNLTIVGGNVTVANNAKISSNIVGAIGSLSVFAPVTGDINTASGQMTLASSINGEVNTMVGNLILTPLAKINGNLTYWSDNPVQLQSGGQVIGNTVQKQPPQPVHETPQEKEVAKTVVTGFVGFFLFMKIIGFLSSLVIGLLWIRFFPVYSKNVITKLSQQPFRLLGIGFLAVIMIPITSVILGVTLIGIPLAILGGLIMAVLFYLSHLVVSLFTGDLVFKKINKKVATGWTFILGLVIYSLISFIPLLGKLALFIAGLIAIGALISQHLAYYQQFRSKKYI